MLVRAFNSCKNFRCWWWLICWLIWWLILNDFTILEYLINPDKRTYWLYILSSFLIAIVFLYFNKRQRRVVFNSKLWLHPSAKLDYYYFILSYFIKVIMIIPIVISAKSIAFFINKNLYYQFGFNPIEGISYESTIIFILLPFY